MSVEFRDHVSCELIEHLASDEIVARRARVSTGRGNGIGDQEKADAGLVRRLLLERHGSPFEHTLFTWEVMAPQFIALESNRHRIASVSAESGRYREMRPIFYRTPATRPLAKVEGSKTMDYHLEEGTPNQVALVRHSQTHIAEESWLWYQKQIEAGVALEVARMVLPQNLMVTWHLSMNARALMNYLSLRIRRDDALFPSKPMLEIQSVAEAMEADFASLMPAAHAAFNENGRVAP